MSTQCWETIDVVEICNHGTAIVNTVLRNWSEDYWSMLHATMVNGSVEREQNI